jgi:hypothetical protein
MRGRRMTITQQRPLFGPNHPKPSVCARPLLDLVLRAAEVGFGSI